jgi:hypothetical protein
MMNDNNISKTIQSLRDRFKMNPPDEAWTKLDADLERQRAMRYKQRGNRFKLLSVGLAMLLISIITYNYLMSSHQSLLSDASVTKNNGNEVDKGNFDSTIGTEQNGWGIQPDSPAPVSNQAKNTTKEFNNTSSANINSKDVTSINNVPVLKNNSVATNAAIAANNSPAYSSINNVVMENNSSSKQDEKAENNPVISSDAAVSNDLKNVEGNNNHSVEADKNDNPNSKYSSDDKSSESPMITGDSIQTKTLKDSILNIEKNKIAHWTASLFYGPNAYAVNRLKVLNQQYALTINSYTQLSTSNYSFNSEAILGYDISKRWSLSTGGIYSTIAYSSTYPTLHASIGSDNLYHYKYHSSCGSIEIPNQPNVVLNANSVLQTPASCAQVINIISVPVLIKYKITKNRFSFYVNTGFAADFIMEEVAKVDINGAEYTIINNITGLRKTNYSYILEAGIDYNLFNGMSFFLEPSFITSVTPIMTNSYYDCYPYSIGILGGIAFHF